MKFWKLAGVSVMALGLVLGMATPALAAPQWGQQTQTETSLQVLHGEVISVDETGESFVIQSIDTEITLTVDADTQYFNMPGLGRALAFTNCVRGRTHLGTGLGLMNQAQLLQAVKPGPSVPGLMARFKNENKMRERLQVCLNAGEGSGGGSGLSQSLGEEAGFSDVTVGSLVAVWSESVDGVIVAARIFIIDPAAGEFPLWKCPVEKCPVEESPLGECPLDEFSGQGFHGKGCSKLTGS